MGSVHLPLWDLYIFRESFQSHNSQKVPPYDLAIFLSSYYHPWRLVSSLHSGEFSVPGIYIETYIYDYVYVNIFMTS